MLESGVLLGVGSAVAWGTGDFAGGLAARRSSGLVVTAGAQLIGLLALLVGVLVLRPAAPQAATIGFGALAGIGGGLGLAALYRGLGLGSMGLVSAVSGLGAVLIPLGVGIWLWGNDVQALQLIGVALALAAVAAASGATTKGVSREGLVLALIAALGFGLWFVFIDRAASHDRLWALVISRASATLLVGGTAAVRARRAAPPTLPLIAVAGVADVAANAMVVLAFATIPVGVAAALSGTYPLATMLLARVTLKESLPRLGLAAVFLAVAGIVFISLGS